MTQEVELTLKGSGEYKSGWITLNRPKALHAISLEMVRAITHALIKWREDHHIRFVVITSSDGRAFCAGGDIRAVYNNRDDRQFAVHYFSEEYRLNYIIKTYPKPFVALVDGIAFGGGVGLSRYARFCIATDRAIFAMPETTIGFFPDVGAGYFLNQAPGFLGRCLGLSGLRVSGLDSVYAGFAHHVIASANRAELHRFLESDDAHYDLLSSLTHWLSQHELSAPATLETHQDVINRCFSHQSVREIIQALSQEENSFAASLLVLLSKNAPLSLCVTLEYLLRSQDLSFAEILEMDFTLSQHFMKDRDFFEGVRCALIDKDESPVWAPSILEEVSPDRILSYFVPFEHSLGI